MKAFEAPKSEYDSFTPEQKDIQKQIDELMVSPAYNDESLRTSFLSRDRRLYAETRAKMDGLFKKLYPEPPEEDDLTENSDKLPASIQEDKQEAPLWQRELIEQGQEEMDQLEGLGFERAEIPDDIQPFQVAALKMQRLNAEGNFQELVPLLERELTTSGFSGMDAFRGFICDGSIGREERAEHIDLILKRIYSANKAKAHKESKL
jgi:hypothetical protein